MPVAARKNPSRGLENFGNRPADWYDALNTNWYDASDTKRYGTRAPGVATMRGVQEPFRARSLAFHPNAPAIVRFDPFRFDLAEGSLWRDGAEVRLPPRSLVILQHLVERAGAIVSKQALIDAGWKDAHVGEASLTEAIGILRQALDDDPQQPRYIQTVHRRGYRFIAPIAVDSTAAPLTPTLSPQAGRGSPHTLAPEGGEGRMRGLARDASAAPDAPSASPEPSPTTAPLPSASSAAAEGT